MCSHEIENKDGSRRAAKADQQNSDDRLPDSDWLTFFRDLYLGFGPPSAILLRCIRRAYRDFNRTWPKSLDPTGQRDVARAAGEQVLVAGLTTLAELHVEQSAFDDWHSQVREALMRATDPAQNGGGLTLGQAQKWVNMSVKYVVGGRVLGLERFESFAHVPIDRILLAELAVLPKFQAAVAMLPNEAWSKLHDEKSYQAFQAEVRRQAAPTSPLALEFGLWLTAQGRGVSG